MKIKNYAVSVIHTGKKAEVYDVDIDAGKFLVIYYTALDECEVYWKTSIVIVGKHTNEYRLAIQAIAKHHVKNSYGDY